MNTNTNTQKPLLTMNVKGMEIRVILQAESPWPYAVQKKVSPKKWEQIDAFVDLSYALTYAVNYVNSIPFN